MRRGAWRSRPPNARWTSVPEGYVGSPGLLALIDAERGRSEVGEPRLIRR